MGRRGGWIGGGWGGRDFPPALETFGTGGCGFWTASLFATLDMRNVGADISVPSPISHLQLHEDGCGPFDDVALQGRTVGTHLVFQGTQP